MAKTLQSLGLDIGTTTTQLVLSRLTVENQASPFTVPQMAITERKVVYQSPVFFTPLISGELVDIPALRQLVTEQYRQAGITREDVDTGAVIITGETSRKENARQVLQGLSDLAGDFVVATAGPHLESVLAAKGAGSPELSLQEGPLLHMDIGGGTSNLALIEEGSIVRTGCLNVGGRLVKFDDGGAITYLSPVLEGLVDWQLGQVPPSKQVEQLGLTLVRALEMAAGLEPVDALYEKLSTKEAGSAFPPVPSGTKIVFSGGVADCMEAPLPSLQYGDLGPVLGRCIRESRLWSLRVKGAHTIRATVIGAGCYSTQLSGSTVYLRGAQLPMKNLPAVVFTEQEQNSPHLPRLIAQRSLQQDSLPVLYFPGYFGASYGQITALAHAITEGTKGPYRVVVHTDMAKALGQALALLQPQSEVVCLDSLTLTEGDYLDIGLPVEGSVPVVIKTLALKQRYKI